MASGGWGTRASGSAPGSVPGRLPGAFGNQAIAAPSGSKTSNIPAGFAAGGGIDNSFSGNAIVLDSVLMGNQALGGDGAVDVAGGTGLGGGIAVGFSTLFGPPNGVSILPDHAHLELIGSTLDFNLAQGGNGGKGSNGGDGLGGALAITVDASASVSDSEIKHNGAVGGAKGKGGSDGHGVGGGVYNLGSYTADLLVLLANNHASTSNDNIFP